MNRRTVEDSCLVIMDENSEKLLSVRESFEDDTLILSLSGKINMNAAHDFEDELTAAASVCNKLVVDFSEIDAISSAGIKALLLVQRILDKRDNSMMKLKSMKPSVYQMFDDMGFTELFEIEN